MLIILGGLPGTGKTTIARELARQIGALHVCIDSIEQVIRDSDVLDPRRRYHRIEAPDVGRGGPAGLQSVESRSRCDRHCSSKR